MSAGNSPSPEASPSRAWEDSRRLRKSESKRSRSMLDLTDAAISQPVQERGREAPSILLPHQAAEYVSHIAIDIGGSLVKLVYFLPDGTNAGGKLHFVKFETAKIDSAMSFIRENCLHMSHRGDDEVTDVVRIKATGGGAFKFSDVFQEKLGVILEKEDEMDCAVSGCNFLLKAVQNEAFSYENGQADFTSPDGVLFPYLLVNIGSGVSMLRVGGDGDFERVSGSNLGGGTFWGLCRLMTGCKNFDEMLELSARGDNSKVDMLVGDIYGDRDYSSIGLSASTIASSFGRVVSEDLDLGDVQPADVAMALCRMVSYNIAHLSYLNAKRYGLPRIFFGGFFIRGHSYTMETLSYAIRFWSKGEMSARFLRHEGYLGAVGAYLKVHPMPAPPASGSESAQGKVRARFVERFSMGTGGEAGNQTFKGLEDKVSWVEKFLRVGAVGMEAAQNEHIRIRQQGNGQADDLDDSRRLPPLSSVELKVGVLHYDPGQEPFPLLSQPTEYVPDTIDITERTELAYWVKILSGQIPIVAEKAIATDGGTDDAKRRASAFKQAFNAQLAKLQVQPASYGKLGLGELFEMREECLREFGFTDVYRMDKERENAAALEVFPDLLGEIDGLDPKSRLLALIEGALAANIFDWGARACVDLYHQGTILEIYRDSRTKLSKRPWRVDHFDEFSRTWFGQNSDSPSQPAPPYRRVIIFVDNAGADIVLGMLPLTREFLRYGVEVVLCANSLPAINDITASELRSLIEQVAELCPIIKDALEAASQDTHREPGTIPPFPGLKRRAPSVSRRLSEVTLDQRGEKSAQPIDDSDHGAAAAATSSSPSSSYSAPESSHPKLERDSNTEQSASARRVPKLYITDNGQGSPCLDLQRVPAALANATVGTDLVILEGMGRAVHTNLNASFSCPSLKLAMIKTHHLAQRLFQGKIYDCVCIYNAGDTH